MKRFHAPSVFVVLQAARAAHDRRDVGERGRCCGSCALTNTAFRSARQPLFGERDLLDHALVGLARVVAEGEDAVRCRIRPSTVGSRSKTSAAALASAKPGMM